MDQSCSPIWKRHILGLTTHSPLLKICVASTSTNTLRPQLVYLKDKRPQISESNVIYQNNCWHCQACYLGMTERDLKKRIGEPRRRCSKMISNNRDTLNLENNSANALRPISTGHSIDLEHPKMKLADQAYNAQRWNSEQSIIAATPTQAIA